MLITHCTQVVINIPRIMLGEDAYSPLCIENIEDVRGHKISIEPCALHTIHSEMSRDALERVVYFMNSNFNSLKHVTPWDEYYRNIFLVDLLFMYSTLKDDISEKIKRSLCPFVLYAPEHGTKVFIEFVPTRDRCSMIFGSGSSVPKSVRNDLLYEAFSSGQAGFKLVCSNSKKDLDRIADHAWFDFLKEVEPYDDFYLRWYDRFSGTYSTLSGLVARQFKSPSNPSNTLYYHKGHQIAHEVWNRKFDACH